jgi:hypothetical protein
MRHKTLVFRRQLTYEPPSRTARLLGDLHRSKGISREKSRRSGDACFKMLLPTRQIEDLALSVLRRPIEGFQGGTLG